MPRDGSETETTTANITDLVTVGQLMDLLSRHPRELEVVVETPGGIDHRTIDYVFGPLDQTCRVNRAVAIVLGEAPR